MAILATLVEEHGTPEEWAMLLPSHSIALSCVAFFRRHFQASDFDHTVRIIDLVPNTDPDLGDLKDKPHSKPLVAAVLYPIRYSSIAKSFWQHTGEGISSRRAELCHIAFKDGFLVPKEDYEQNQDNFRSLGARVPVKGPRRYQKSRPVSSTKTVSRSDSSFGSGDLVSSGRAVDESAQFVEERYGRNLDLSLAGRAKLAIRRRIAGALTTDVDLDQTAEGISSDTVVREVQGLSADDILEKWGPGCLFYGNGSSEDLEDLERRCESGERYLALFCEFPGNPLLKCPDLRRIRALANRFDFAVVVDETIGNFLNIRILPDADIVVSSLTKVFSGDSNVMGGSLIINPLGQYYDRLKLLMASDYEDNYWPEDALFMERNSRDFVSRIARINANAEAICDTLLASGLGSESFRNPCGRH
ncbi:MAG: hypothetical protein Q9220_004496 [cf. Caloplaca sp. 1 TL-2023]